MALRHARVVGHHGRQGQVIINTGAAGSQGYRYIDSNGNPVSGDATYADPARQLWEYTTQGDITIGQGGWSAEGLRGSDRRVIVQGSAPKGTTFIRFNRDGDACAVAAIQGHGAELRWFDASEWPSFPFLDPEQPPSDPPVEPEPEPAMQIPTAAWDVIKQMHAKFSDDFPPTEDGARAFTEKTIQQLKHSFPSGGWCWKKASEGRPPSKDCAARQIEGRFEGWDILSAAGASGPRNLANFPPTYHDLIAEGNQVPIEVDAKNHLGTAPPVEDPDPGDVDDGPGEPEPGDNALAMLARIEKKVDRLLTVFRV
jgi:hypothetical protein